MSETTGIKPIDYLKRTFGLDKAKLQPVSTPAAEPAKTAPLTELQDFRALDQKQKANAAVIGSEITRFKGYQDRTKFVDNQGKTQDIAIIQAIAKEQMDGADPQSQRDIHQEFNQTATEYIDQKHVEGHLSNYTRDLNFILDLLPTSEGVDRLRALVTQNQKADVRTVDKETLDKLQNGIRELQVQVVQRTEAFLSIPELFLSDKAKQLQALLKNKRTVVSQNSSPRTSSLPAASGPEKRMVSYNTLYGDHDLDDFDTGAEMTAAEKAFTAAGRVLINGDLFTSSRTSNLETALKQFDSSPTPELVRTIDVETRVLIDEVKNAARKLLQEKSLSDINRRALEAFVNNQRPPLVPAEITKLINSLEKLQAIDSKEALIKEASTLLYTKREMDGKQFANRLVLLNSEQRILLVLLTQMSSDNEQVSLAAMDEAKSVLPDLLRAAEHNKSLPDAEYDAIYRANQTREQSISKLVPQFQGLARSLREAISSNSTLTPKDQGGDGFLRSNVMPILDQIDKGQPSEALRISLSGAYHGSAEWWSLQLFDDSNGKSGSFSEAVAFANSLGVSVNEEEWSDQLKKPQNVDEYGFKTKGDMITYYHRSEKMPTTLMKVGNVVVEFTFSNYGQLKLTQLRIDHPNYWHNFFGGKKFSPKGSGGSKENPFTKTEFIANHKLVLDAIPSLEPTT